MGATQDSHAWRDNQGRAVKEARFRLATDNPFRMIYRAPESLTAGAADSTALQNGEIVNLARVLVSLGVEHVHLTAATTSNYAGLPGLIHGIKANAGAQTVSLTTMGTDLAATVSDLHAAGLDSIHLSLDTLRHGRYMKITGTQLLDQACSGYEAAKKAGYESVKINTVVMKGVNADELDDFVAMVEETHDQVRFIELMPFTNVGWMQGAVFPWSLMVENVRCRYPLVEIPDRQTLDLKEYRIPDRTGTVGFVPALSETFCNQCDRIRFTADGRVQSCQFAEPDSRIREALRRGVGDAELAEVVKAVMNAKPAHRPELEQLRQIAECSPVATIA